MKLSVLARPHLNGFALVVTLSLMILLTVIAVGLLSLSSITLRASTQEMMQAKARANARLALMLAIGELQKEMGPDQRVSANGAILANTTVKNSQWTGVWDSWKAGSQPAGSISPDGPSEHRTIAGATNSGMNPTYLAQRNDHFRAWLVSLNPTQAADIKSAQSLTLTGGNSPASSDSGVELLGSGSFGTTTPATPPVQAGLVPIRASASATTTGRYGWWVGDESQKARILNDSYMPNTSPTLADRIHRHSAPGSTGTSIVKGLEAIKNDGELKGLPSLRTLDLLTAATGKPSENFLNVTPFSYQVLADVREGGLKRDLTTLLERPISVSETGDDYMLYRFGAPPEECVPIQDLAAYYQLYDYDGYPSSRGRKEGVKYSSNPSPNNGTNYPSINGIQLGTPDFGDNTAGQLTDPLLQSKYLREYTTLYRRPVPVKIQLVLTMTAVARDPAKITATSPDTHALKLGFLPAITLWNPTNLPLAMHIGDLADDSVMLRFGNLPMNITWKKNGSYTSLPVNLSWAAQGSSSGGTIGNKSFAFNVYFSSTRPIIFKPGEVRVFSLPYIPGDFDFAKNQGETVKLPQEVAPGWNPSAFLQMKNSAPGANSKDIENNCLTFKSSDSISFDVRPETGATPIENASSVNEIPGAGFQWMLIQKSLQSRTSTMWDYRDYQLVSRYGSGSSVASFNAGMISKGFPGGVSSISGASRSGSQIIAKAASNTAWPFLQFAFMAGCETNELANGGAFSGRKFSSRPFLHSTAMSPSFIDDDSGTSLYNYGWNWWIEEVSSILEANVQEDPVTKNGFYGGGYTPENGTTHVVQQEVPVAPPMSIASLSHAHLGGFSIATRSSAGNFSLTSDTFQNVTATGQGGLAPHTLQAIGNSYAHPNIPANAASTPWVRKYSGTEPAKNRILADHSYLANKALWDDCFFSSISPARAKIEIFGSTADRTAEKVAKDFFFPAASTASIPLPNRRITPYKDNLDPAKLTSLFTKANDYQQGLADRIAAHLMVEGPFNVNSTSIDAWKIFLSSLRGKKVAYLDKSTSLTAGVKLSEATLTGTPVGMSSLPNDKPIKGSSKDPSEAEQWTSWRELSDAEISELATAIVKQVKLRGPFLSMSEFINRRLDSGSKELSVKGALQAALDDEMVSINSGFRDASREFTSAEISALTPAFPEALEGPVAYGSSAYVDQADILRNFSEQLTPRGDTFVIRAYGDSVDANGKVEAQAWCEAVIQRVPDYLDPADEPHEKQANLKSNINKTFGRKLRTVSLRWLSPKEI